MSKPVLHSYWRSSASYRVRIALKLKGIDYEYVAHHLVRGEHRAPEYLKLNPLGFVPALATPDGAVLTQSLAICEFLDEMQPEPPLLPADPAGRARVRALAQLIACDIHPLNNSRVLAAIRSRFGADDAAVTEWFRHWAGEGMRALETSLSSSADTSRFCHGDRPTLADICLVPQVFNNKRWGLDPTLYPTVMRINEACMELPAFADATPGKQPDAE